VFLLAELTFSGEPLGPYGNPSATQFEEEIQLKSRRGHRQLNDPGELEVKGIAIEWQTYAT
jgi:hypothetical protein